MRSAAAVIGLALVFALVRDVAAEPCDAIAMRARLEREAGRARGWNLGWRLALTGASVAQAVLAITPTLDRTSQIASEVGAAQAGIGAIAAWIMPLRVELPDDRGCAASRAARARTGRDERRMFFLLHLGNLVINGGGAIVIGELASWPRAAVAFALGYTVAAIETYTLPRGAWHDARAWSAAVVPSGRGMTFVVGRAF